MWWILERTHHPRFPYRLRIEGAGETVLSLGVQEKWPGPRGRVFDMIGKRLKKLAEMFVPRPFDCIQVEVSSVCNCSCPYCVQACYKDQWKGGLMDRRTFERLEPAFTMTHLVFLQGWGESLLHPEFWRMVQRAKSSGTKVGFTTNGTHLDGENLSHLFDSGVDIMGVSLAGVVPETHARFRRGCDLERLDAALRKLREMKQGQRDQGPSVHIAFMLLRSNLHELAELPALAARWGVSQIVVSHLNLIASEVMQEQSLLTHPELLPEVAATVQKAKEQAAQKGMELHYHSPNLEEPGPLCTENVLRNCFVSYRGDVSPCVMTNISVQESARPLYYFMGQAYTLENHIFGNINERSLQEIWKSGKAREFRADFRKRLEMKSPGRLYPAAPCQHCYKLLEG